MEFLTILAVSKEMGLDPQVIVPMGIVYFLLNRSFSSQFERLIQAINSLEKTHNERLKRIEDHVGLR